MKKENHLRNENNFMFNELQDDDLRTNKRIISQNELYTGKHGKR